MISLPTFKRGDTWSLTSTLLKNKDGVDLTQVTIKSQIKTSNMDLIANLQVAKADQKTYPGVFVLYPENPDTTNWPIGRMLCDVRFSQNGELISSETFSIQIIEEVTK